jgi:uncharacterized protein YjbI with pentapeptide repeats
VENLGDDAMDVRLGGVYALQRIMEDSRRDHPTVANVLATFVRTHAAKSRKKGEDVPADVHAALAVIAYRESARDDYFKLDLRRTQLSGSELMPRGPNGDRADLSKATLAQANLSGAGLWGANMRHTNLSIANLRNADLFDADLRDALLYNADLREADLSGADLRGANLMGADLTGADLEGADLTGADLREADLTDADLHGTNLTGADLTDTKGRKPA